MTVQYFIIENCKNKKNKDYDDYYVYVNDTDQLFHKKKDMKIQES